MLWRAGAMQEDAALPCSAACETHPAIWPELELNELVAPPAQQGMGGSSVYGAEGAKQCGVKTACTRGGDLLAEVPLVVSQVELGHSLVS
jgi:hypothetical protein